MLLTPPTPSRRDHRRVSLFGQPFPRNRGFSLVELLVVVAIIGILIGAALPFYQDYVQESKVAKAENDLDIVRQALALYEVNEGVPYYPRARSDNTGTLYGIHSAGGDLRGLKGAYLSDLPLDPWGREYKYDRFGKFVFSMGPVINDYSDPTNRVSQADDIKAFVVKDLTIRKVEWVDRDNSNTFSSGDILELHFSNYFLNSAAPAETDFEFFDPTTTNPQDPLTGATTPPVPVLDSANYPAAPTGDVDLAGGVENHSLTTTATIEKKDGVHYLFKIGLGPATANLRLGITRMRLLDTGAAKFKSARMNRQDTGATTIYSNFPETGDGQAVAFSEPVVIKKKS